MVGCKRVFNLRCQDQSSYDLWVLKLKHSIYLSNGYKKKLSMDRYIEDISKYFDYWRFLRITEDAFIKQAEVGDIILCSKISKMAMPRRQDMKISKTFVDTVCLVVKL